MENPGKDFDARGGFQVIAKKGRGGRECDHSETVTVRNSGLERTVCEKCGNVSFRALEGLSGSARRSQFGRLIERPNQAVQ